MFWWIIAVVGATALLFVVTGKESPIRVTVDEWQQQPESVSVDATLENDLAEDRVVTVEFLVEHWSNDWTSSGYSFFGRGEHRFEIEGKGRRKIQVVVPILRKTSAKVHVSASVIGIENLQPDNSHVIFYRASGR